MIRLIKCEFMKARRCYVFLTALVITAICIAAGLKGDYSKVLHLGWRMWLYQLPLMNAIFLPLTATVIASRICGIEHKGVMLKQLCCTVKRGKLYDAKLLFGLGIMVICVALSWTATVLYGNYIGFDGSCPMDLYLLYLLFTIVPTIAIYIFQHTLSIIFKNQAIPLLAGITGEFIGLFSMFLPMLPWLRRITLWGYYGTLQFVGLFDWTKETRYENAHFDVLPIDWTFFAVLIAATIIMYLIGRYWFSKKEV